MADPKYVALRTLDELMQQAHALLSEASPTGQQRARLALLLQLSKNLRETIDWSWPTPRPHPGREAA
jgi:hypothetical protein